MTGSGSAPRRIAPRKGFHPVVWVLIVFAAILALLIATVAITGWYLVNQFSEDPAAATEPVLSVPGPCVEETGHAISLAWKSRESQAPKMTKDRSRVILS